MNAQRNKTIARTVFSLRRDGALWMLYCDNYLDTQAVFFHSMRQCTLCTRHSDISGTRAARLRSWGKIGSGRIPTFRHRKPQWSNRSRHAGSRTASQASCAFSTYVFVLLRDDSQKSLRPKSKVVAPDAHPPRRFALGTYCWTNQGTGFLDSASNLLVFRIGGRVALNRHCLGCGLVRTATTLLFLAARFVPIWSVYLDGYHHLGRHYWSHRRTSTLLYLLIYSRIFD